MIPSELIVTGFKKCCISNFLDDFEYDFLWQDKSDCEKGDGGEQSENENS
jgi:hypothetical protein